MGFSSPTVTVDTYEAALGDPLPDDLDDPIRIDASGYSPAVADHLGKDYLDGAVLVFGTDQFNTTIEREKNAIIDSVIGRLEWGHPNYVETATAAAPLIAEPEIDIRTDGFQVTATFTPVDDDRFMETRQAEQQLQSIDTDSLARQEELDASLAVADSLDIDNLNGIDDQERTISFETDSFYRETDSGASYVIHGSDPWLVETGDTSIHEEYDLYFPDWSNQSLNDLIQTLASDGRIDIDGTALQDELEEQSRQLLETLEDDITDQDLDEAAYAAVTAFLDETIDDEYRALRALDHDEDLSIQNEADWAKLAFLQSDEPGIEHLLAGIAEEEQSRITVQRFEGQGTNLDMLTETYHEWEREYSFGLATERPYNDACSLVEDLQYNAETIEQFCSETTLTRNDGVFLAALINESEADEVTLPDLTNVKYVGYRNQDGTDIIVEGNTGNYPAQNMEGGRLEIQGDIDYGDGWVGDEMTGGTVYVHGEGKRDPHKEGGSLVMNGYRPAFRNRPSNDDSGLLDDLL